jgi:16S rRNA (cytidine1402-2'-O)-methyltransferase
MPGTLYLVATPIGNLADVTLRSLEVLKSVSVIACEDTRVTRRLLARYQIATPLVSYHEHNERQRAVELSERLLAGEDLALVTDAGTPGVSDPGYRLVVRARELEIPVRVVPGPSAVLAALSASGLPSSSFVFLGFLPTRPAARNRAIEALAREPRTAVVFESPRRLARLLRELAARLGPRPAYLGRELTKIHEEHRWGTLAELARWAETRRLKGELTLVVAGGQVEEAGGRSLDSVPLLERFRRLTGSGLTRRQAVKALASERHQPARRIYQQILLEEERGRAG